MAKFCKKCGTQINEGETCPKCADNSVPTSSVGTPPLSISKQKTTDNSQSSIKKFLLSLKNRMGIGDPENDGSGIYERGMLITPDSISSNEGEIPVKQYDVAVLRTRLKFMRAEGRMQVTNKRLLFRATGRSVRGRTTLQHEFAIDDIAGIEARRCFRFSFFDFFCGLALAALFFFAFFVMFGAPGKKALSVVKEAESNIMSARSNVYEKQSWVARAKEAVAIAQENVAAAQKNVATAQDALKKARSLANQSTSYYEYYEKQLSDMTRRLSERLEQLAERENQLSNAQWELTAAERQLVEAEEKLPDTKILFAVVMIFIDLIGVSITIPIFKLIFTSYKKFWIKLMLAGASCGIIGSVYKIIEPFSAFSHIGFSLKGYNDFVYLFTAQFLFSALLALFTLIICLVLIFLVAFLPDLIINIKTKAGVSGTGSIEIRRQKMTGILSFLFGMTSAREEYTGYTDVMPTAQTESAIREIGAIINDVQKLGDFGIEKWK